MDRLVIRDIAFVILRLILGTIFTCYGWDKVLITGVDKMTDYFVAANTPQTHLIVWVVALVGLVEGALLILGLLVLTVATIPIVEVTGAWQSMHLDNGPFIRDNSAELAMSLIDGLVMALVSGAGRSSLDRQFIR